MFVAFIKLIQGGELGSRVTMAGFLWSFAEGIYVGVVVVGHPCWPGGKGGLHDVEGREKGRKREEGD